MWCVPAAPATPTALAQKLSAEGYELIVAAGGDGTICETAQGLIEASSPAVLGILPGRHGNDYCRCLSIPSRPAEAAEVLLSGVPRTVDVMQVDEFIGLNISTIGFDSAVAQNAAKFPALGRFSYLFSVLYTAARFRRPELTISLDDGQVFTGKRYLFAARVRHALRPAASGCCPAPTLATGCWTTVCSTVSECPATFLPPCRGS